MRDDPFVFVYRPYIRAYTTASMRSYLPLLPTILSASLALISSTAYAKAGFGEACS
jgi:hypothetical protein